ncbi:alpha/beta hydrolase [Bdellovibrionota bacterium]
MKTTIKFLLIIALLLFPASVMGKVKDPAPGRAACDPKIVLKTDPKIAGTVCKPRYVTEETVAIVLVQESNKLDRDWNSKIGKKLAGELTMRGVLTFRFDMPGKGKSGKLPKGKDEKVYGKIIGEAAKWINKVFGIKKKRIFLLAHGDGAKHIVQAANHWRKLKWNYGGLIFVESNSSVATAEDLTKLREPAMIARGTRDGAVSIEEIDKIQKGMKRSRGTRLSTIEGMGHDLRLSDKSISYSLVIAIQQWADKWGRR